jgi:arylsulfatase A-like enzyme
MHETFTLAALLACAGMAAAQDNALILLADDVGIDQLASYGLGSDLPPTPVLDQMAASGVLFRNAYATPVCSPSRAQILTGRQPFRTGIGHIVGAAMISPELYQLPPEETILPEMLELAAPGLFRTAAIGKWHLYEGPGFEFAPTAAGFDHFSGTPANFGFDPVGYYNWIKVVDGSYFVVLNTYATTDQVDDALAFLQTAPEPWLCYVAFSAAHVPFHAPPQALHTQDLSAAGPPALDPRPYYKATVEALDNEIGRLLAGIAPMLPRTNVFFMGDNGTPFEVVLPPFDPVHAKTTLYEGGCHVPMLVMGPAVAQPGTECTALVQLTDIYATIAELADVDLKATLPVGTVLDSVSIVPYLDDPAAKPRRGTAFSQIFGPLGSAPYNLEGYMIRDERYKLIRIFTPGAPGYPVEMYDLSADPHEQVELLAGGLSPVQRDAYRRLDREARELLRPAEITGPSGSESHVVLGASGPTAGGGSTSTTYRISSEVGLAAGAEAKSTTRASRPGTAWLAGGIASDHPVVFGFGEPYGAPAGGEVRAVFGFDLGELASSSTLDLELGGSDATGVAVLSDTLARITTPAGLNRFGNPAGVETLWVHSDDGQILAHRAFAYRPAIDMLEPPRVGGPFRLRVAVAPGDAFQILWGGAVPGLALATPPLSGAFELLAKAHKLTPVAFSGDGEAGIDAKVPEQTALVGLTVDLQGVAVQIGASLTGAWTNRLCLVMQPPI